MPKKLPQRDPIAAYTRSVTAARLVCDGVCACGEARPEALIRNSKPLKCHACKRKNDGRSTSDDHHVAGESNSPVTIPIPVNDHKAQLSVDQYDWPRQTLENPNGSPLLAGAAGMRGYVDTNLYLIEQFILPNAAMLEKLDAYFVREFGAEWWNNPKFQQLLEPECRIVNSRR
jgi:hypothetical protein